MRWQLRAEMSLPLTVAAGTGLAYLASGWDFALFTTNNIIIVGMRLARVWQKLVNSPVQTWRPIMDKADRIIDSLFLRNCKLLGCETETVKVVVPDGEIDVYVHKPKISREPNSKLPLIVWFHGGGMVLNSAHDMFLLSNKGAFGFGILNYFNGQAVIASVQYRRAPENKFPVGVEDSIAATHWLSDNASRWGADSSRVCVAGYSAGGYLASVVHQAARDRGFPLCSAVMICPMLRRGATTRSYIENGHRSDLPTIGMIWFWSLFCPDASSVGDPRCTPIHGIGSGQLAPCIMVTAKYDVLRDEGVEYYEALRDAGIQVDHVQCIGSHLGAGCDKQNWSAVLHRWSSMLGIQSSSSRL